jgi:hypothetical protein
MRIYVPATLDELDSASVTATAARWTVAPRGAHAVRTALLAALPDEDTEGREYAAFLAAAHDSLALVAGRPDAPPLRVVVSLEVPDAVVSFGALDAAPGADSGPSAVRIAREVTVPIVAVHVDEPEAAADVRAVLAAADGDTELDDALQRVTDRDLLWYDATEVHQIPRP